MHKAFHGSPFLFDSFNLDKAGDATGIKFGYGVYLTEVEASAVYYSQPRNIDLMPEHYLYTVEIPDLTPDNHLISAKPVEPSIIARTEKALNTKVPEKVAAAGKDFRKWIGMHLLETKKAGLQVEKKAAEFLNSIGVLFSVVPRAPKKPEGPKTIVVFDAKNVTIVGREYIEIEYKRERWVLVSRKDV